MRTGVYKITKTRVFSALANAGENHSGFFCFVCLSGGSASDAALHHVSQENLIADLTDVSQKTTPELT